MIRNMNTTTAHKSITLDDFDALMDEAAGKPRNKATLTSYGPVNPHLAPISLPDPILPPRYQPLVIPRPAPVIPPVYYPAADPMPRSSAMIHALLFFTTGGIGNIIYQLHIVDKRNAWRSRHQY